MIRKYALVASAMLVLLAGCGGGGDIKINPSTTDNSVNNSNNTTTTGGSSSSNPCASYTTDAGATKQGTFDGTNCTYSASFVDSGNNLQYDLTIPALTTGGAHIFQGSLFVGNSCKTDACLATNGITKGGDGPTLTIEAGATLAFQSKLHFMVINRGSQIIAQGTANNPITLTSTSDVFGVAGPEDVQQWGGLVIDGFGVTNKCSYTGTRGVDLALAAECHVASEGSAGQDENYYGGNNDDDNSGILQYVVVKYTGAEVANGDELNGITWGAVGRGTTVDHIEAYSVYDDGMEFFGGAVNVSYYAAVYARDDSIDIDEGYIGTFDTALVIQSKTFGNSCIEADGLGSFSSLSDATIADFIARKLESAPTIHNLTCIISPTPTIENSDPGNGWHFREGIAPTVTDSMVISTFLAPDATSATDNYCVTIENASLQNAADGLVTLKSNIFDCEEKTGGKSLPAPDGRTVEQFVIDSGNQFATVTGVVDPTATADTDLQLLEGTPPIFSIDYATMMVDGAAPTSDAPQAGDYIGALSQSADNPFANWTWGIFEGSRAQPLYFETP